MVMTCPISPVTVVAMETMGSSFDSHETVLDTIEVLDDDSHHVGTDSVVMVSTDEHGSYTFCFCIYCCYGDDLFNITFNDWRI
jgi:hypothetical protein